MKTYLPIASGAAICGMTFAALVHYVMRGAFALRAFRSKARSGSNAEAFASPEPRRASASTGIWSLSTNVGIVAVLLASAFAAWYAFEQGQTNGILHALALAGPSAFLVQVFILAYQFARSDISFVRSVPVYGAVTLGGIGWWAVAFGLAGWMMPDGLNSWLIAGGMLFLAGMIYSTVVHLMVRGIVR